MPASGSSSDARGSAFSESEALTLRVYDYGDTSQVAHLLVPRVGKIHVLAKGSRRPKNAFQGSLDLLVHGRAGWYRRPRTGLHLLGTFEVLDTFPSARSDLRRYYAACHVLEALHESTRQEEPIGTLFDLGLATLRVVDRSGDPLRVLPVFHADLLRQLGSTPRLDACVGCETPADDVSRPRLSPNHGGLLCPACEPGARFAFDVSRETVGVLSALVRRSFRDGLAVDVPPRLRRPAAGALAALLRNVLERDLPTLAAAYRAL
jgi:DNA repair protein RecO (recombination protein O)